MENVFISFLRNLLCFFLFFFFCKTIIWYVVLEKAFISVGQRFWIFHVSPLEGVRASFDSWQCIAAFYTFYAVHLHEEVWHYSVVDKCIIIMLFYHFEPILSERDSLQNS